MRFIVVNFGYGWYLQKVVLVFFVFSISVLRCNNVGCVTNGLKKKMDRTSGGSELFHRSAELGCHIEICIWVLHHKPR